MRDQMMSHMSGLPSKQQICNFLSRRMKTDKQAVITSHTESHALWYPTWLCKFWIRRQQRQGMFPLPLKDRRGKGWWGCPQEKGLWAAKAMGWSIMNGTDSYENGLESICTTAFTVPEDPCDYLIEVWLEIVLTHTEVVGLLTRLLNNGELPIFQLKPPFRPSCQMH